jgi:hypothetical protein
MPRPVVPVELTQRLHGVQQTITGLKGRQTSLPHLQREPLGRLVSTAAAREHPEVQPDTSRATGTSGQAPLPPSRTHSSSPGTPPVESEAGLWVLNSDSGSDYNNSAPKGSTRVDSAAAMAMTALKAEPAPVLVARQRRRKPRTVHRAPST